MKYELTPDLLTGNEAIDRQHKALFDAINSLMSACSQGKGREEVVKAAQFLLQYTTTHFADEEKLQRESTYPDYANHKKYHEHYKGVVKNLVDKMKVEGATIALVGEVNVVVVQWLTNHIKKEDQKLAKHLKTA